MADLKEYIPEPTLDALKVWFRARYKAFIRAVFAYARDNPSATVAQVKAYAEGLEQVSPAATNTDLITDLAVTWGLSGTQALAIIRDHTNDDILQMMFAHGPRTADEIEFTQHTGSIDRLFDEVAPPLNTERHDTLDGDNYVTETIHRSTTREAFITYAIDKTGPRWTSTETGRGVRDATSV